MNALKIAQELADAKQTCANIASYLHCWDKYGGGPYGPPTTKDKARLARAMAKRDKLAERLEKMEEKP